MNIEEIQLIWSEMSDQLEKQKTLTNELIMKMTKDRYTRKFDKLGLYEGIGAIICFIMAFYTLFNIRILDTWYLLSCGLFTVVLLIILPILTLASIRKLKRIDISKHNFTEMIVKYDKTKKQMLLIQRLGIYLSFLLIFTILPVFSKIMKGKDIFLESSGTFWIYVLIMSVFLFFFSRWGYKCYLNVTQSAENVLKELDS